ncbi:hypothetical protein OIE43_18960 [Streptomyces pseudovenezuelae]|uniref:hypothetical protein n=1 Tax=Streptomyces pseudovenezuelae TaxID=67350 RepID=UPI002E311600|nr:hypothetical protein [Streptomyces pseudovenezuelae]
MISALDTYLGWDTPEHYDGCKRPAWDIGIRRDENTYRRTWLGDPPLTHSCPAEECEHSNSFTKTTVRLVCKSCGAAHLISGEGGPDAGVSMTSTKHLAYGLAPRQAGGLLLWPAQPWMDFGRAVAEEPYDYVVTRTGVKHVTKDVVVGQLTQGRGKLGGTVWAALAVPDPEGQYGFAQRIRWAQCNDGRGNGGSPLRTVSAAARWVGARLAERQAGGGAA